MRLDICSSVNTLRWLEQGQSTGDAREEIRASTDVIMQEAICRLLCSKILCGIGPQDVAHEALRGRFAEAVDLRGSVGQRRRR